MVRRKPDEKHTLDDPPLNHNQEGNMNTINPKENFCIDGEWFHWEEMTSTQKEKKKNQKIAIAEASKDESMEAFWKDVDTT